MSSSIDARYAVHRLAPSPVARAVGFVFLIVAEMATVTCLFEPKFLAGNDQAWAKLLLKLHGIPHLGMAVAASLALFWSARLRADLEQAASRANGSYRSWPYAIAQLAAFGTLLWLSGRVLGSDLRGEPYAAVWFAAWLGAATATLGFWIAAALPPPLWRTVATRACGLLAAGVAVGIAACYAGSLTAALWPTLGAWTLRVVHALLRTVCVETVCQPDALIVGTPKFTVSVLAPCSGFEGIGLIWVFLAVYLVVSRHRLRFPHALVLVPIGTVVIWLANAMRIAGLVLVGTWGDPAVAAGGFHSQMGWLAFNAVGLGLVAVSGRWSWIRSSETPGACEPGPSPASATTAYLAPLMAIVAVTMVTGAFSSGFDGAYPLRVIAAVAVLAVCWTGRARGSVTRTAIVSWEAVLLGVAVFALWIALEPAAAGSASDTPLARGLARLPRGAAWAWLLFRVIGSVITVPIAEELAFRGYLARRLIAPDFDRVPVGTFSWMSFLVSSIIFGLMHGRWLAGTLAGMLYAVATYRRGRLGDAIAAHATTNALIAADVLLTGNWLLWS